MWPWGTIRRLRRELADECATSDRLETEGGKVREAYRQLNMLYRQACTDRHSFREERDEALRSKIETQGVLSKRTIERDAEREGNAVLQRRIADLTAQVLKLQKNNTHDPKTGRFVKKET